MKQRTLSKAAVLTYPVEREQLFAVLEGAISKGQRN